MKRSFLAFLSIISALICDQSCVEKLLPDDGDNTDPEQYGQLIEQDGGVVLSSNTVILDDVCVNKIVELNDEYMIVKDLNIGVDLGGVTKAGDSGVFEVDAGKYFICKPNELAPRGFFGKILSVEAYSPINGFRVAWAPQNTYSLSDVIIFDQNKDECPDEIEIESVEPVEGADIEFTGGKLTITATKKFNDNSSVSISLTLAPRLDPDMDFNFDHGHVTASMGVAFTPNIRFDATATLQVKGKIPLVEIPPIKLLAKPFVMMIGTVPLVITTELNIEPALTFTGKLSAAGNVFNWDETYTSSLSFDSKSEDKLVLTANHTKNSDPSQEDKMKFSLDGEVGLSVPFMVKFYMYNWKNCNGEVGPELYAKVKQNLFEYTNSGGLMWGSVDNMYLSFGLNLKAKANISVLKWNVTKAALEGSLNLAEWTATIPLQTKRPIVHTFEPKVLADRIQLRAAATTQEDGDKIKSWGFGYYVDGMSADTPTLVEVPKDLWTLSSDPATSGMMEFTYSLTGIESEKNYTFFAFAESEKNGMSYGESVTVKTLNTETDVKTLVAMNLGSTSADVSVSVATSTEVREVGVVYSATELRPELGMAGCFGKIAVKTNDCYTASLDGLTPGTTYHARGYAVVRPDGETDMTFYGNPYVFTTHGSQSGGITDVPGEKL